MLDVGGDSAVGLNQLSKEELVGGYSEVVSGWVVVDFSSC